MHYYAFLRIFTHFKTASYKFSNYDSYFPRTVVDCNALPESARSAAPSADSFRAALYRLSSSPSNWVNSHCYSSMTLRQ